MRKRINKWVIDVFLEAFIVAVANSILDLLSFIVSRVYRRYKKYKRKQKKDIKESIKLSQEEEDDST